MATATPRGSIDGLNDDDAHATDTSVLSMDVVAASHMSDDMLRKSTAELRTAACRQLTHVRLDGLQLQTLDAAVLQQLTSCRSLYLQNNRLSNVRALSVLPSLTFLVLSHNLLSQVAGLHGLSALLFLDISHNLIQQLDFAELPSSIRYIKVAGNPCNEQADSTDQLLAYLPSLKEVDGVSVKHHPACTDTGAATSVAAAAAAAAAAAVQPHTTAATVVGSEHDGDADTPVHITSCLLALNQMDKTYARRIPSATQQSTEEHIEIEPAERKRPLNNVTEPSPAVFIAERSSCWVADVDCERQLIYRGMFSSSQQQQLVAEVSSRSVGQLMADNSMSRMTQFSLRSFSAPVHASAIPAADKSSATSKCGSNPVLACHSIQQTSARTGQVRKRSTVPRLLTRPRSAQAGTVMPVQARLQSQKLVAATKGTVRRQSTPAVEAAAAVGVAAAQQQMSAPLGRQIYADSATDEAVLSGPVKARDSTRQTTFKAGSSKHTKAAQVDSTTSGPTRAANSRHMHSAPVVNASPPAGLSSKPPRPQRVASSTQAAQSSIGCGAKHKGDACGRQAAGKLRTDAKAAAVGGASSRPSAMSAPGPPRRLPPLSSSTATAPAAAPAQPVVAAVLLQPEDSLCIGGKAKLAPINHPAVRAEDRFVLSPAAYTGHEITAVQGDMHPAPADGGRTDCSSGVVMPCTSSSTQHIGSHSHLACLAQAQVTGDQQASRCQHLPTSNGVVAKGDYQRTDSGELAMESLRRSLVLDRCHGLQGCGIDSADMQECPGTGASSRSITSSCIGQQQLPISNQSASSMLDALAFSSKSSLDKTLDAMRGRHRQRTSHILQQHKQVVAAEKQHVQRLWQQLKQHTAGLNKSLNESKQQLVATRQPQPCSPQQDVSQNIARAQQKEWHQGSTDSCQESSLAELEDRANNQTGCNQSHVPVQVLTAALDSIRTLRTSGDSNLVAGHGFATASQQDTRMTPVADISSRVAQLQRKLCAAAQELQQAAESVGHVRTAAKEVSPAVASAIGVYSAAEAADRLACSTATSKHNTTSAGTVEATQDVEELEFSKHDGTDTSHGNSDEDLDPELQAMLDRMFKPTLPVCDTHLESNVISTAGGGSSSGEFNIPIGLYTSSMPAM